MTFIEKLKNLGAAWSGDLPQINDIVDDPREIRPGNLFVLSQGAYPLSDSQIED